MAQFIHKEMRRKFDESIKHHLGLQYPSPLCRLIWAVTHVIGLHIELTILGECDVASTTILRYANV